MRRLLRNHSLLFQLLVGTLTIFLVTTGLWAIVERQLRGAQDVHGSFTLATPMAIAVIVGLNIAFFLAFTRSLSRKIRRVTDAATRIGSGQFHVRVPIDGTDDLSELGVQFNAMAETLTTLIAAVQKSGIQINTSVMEIAATARQQQATASEIATTTTEVGATSREISATAHELSISMKELTEVAERTTELAGSGQTGITRMKGTMQQITSASDSISARLAALSEKAGNINTVVTTIAKVADQTNMLSLNAAIEAEKAGEYGRGFAVVAAEIRRLADQTALATGDIERIVKEMQGAVTAGVMGMGKFSDEVRRGVDASAQVGEQLSDIIEQIQTLTPSFEQVNLAMQAQSEGAQQISDALAQLGSSAQQTADSLVQSSKAIEQLNDASRDLQAGVLRFTVSG